MMVGYWKCSMVCPIVETKAKDKCMTENLPNVQFTYNHFILQFRVCPTSLVLWLSADTLQGCDKIGHHQWQRSCAGTRMKSPHKWTKPWRSRRTQRTAGQLRKETKGSFKGTNLWWLQVSTSKSFVLVNGALKNCLSHHCDRQLIKSPA